MSDIVENNRIRLELILKRKQCGMRQADVAKAVNLTQSAISMLETGSREINKKNAEKLLSYYDKKLNCPAGAVSGNDTGKTLAMKSVQLLIDLGEAPGSEELSRAVNKYISLCAYALLRRLYLLNPHNTHKIFSLSDNEFEDKAVILYDELNKIAAAVAASEKINASKLELGVGSSSELLDVICACESCLYPGRNSDGEGTEKKERSQPYETPYKE